MNGLESEKMANERVEITVEEIFFYLKSGDLDKLSEIKDFPKLVRAVAYAIKKGKYHREALCRALVVLSAYAPVYYRDIAWALIQEVPLSHLLYLPDVIRKPSKENKRRLRLALVTRIANASEKEIIRAFFINPNRFRKLFSYFNLPKDKIHNKPIKNKRYLLAAKLANMSIKEALKELNLTLVDLLMKYKIPFHVIANLITSPEEAEKIAENLYPADYLRHVRWFKEVLGEEEAFSILKKKLTLIKDPLEFLGVLSHLLETGAISPEIAEYIEKKVKFYMNKLAEESGVKTLALLIDVSGSMENAIELAKSLLIPFRNLGIRIPYIITFNQTAARITAEELANISAGGMTSIGSALKLLYTLIKKEKIMPDAVLLISDLCHNTEPDPEDIIKLFDKLEAKPPIIAIVLGSPCELHLDYPMAEIRVLKFHHRLISSVLSLIFNAIKDVLSRKEELEIIKSTRPLAEDILSVELPKRPGETLKRGYIEQLLLRE